LCVPTFKYNGSTYRGCTTANNLGKGWCSHDDVYAGRFSDCSNTCPTNTSAEPCGWRPQRLCAPTFKYNGSFYRGCTTANNLGKGWCSHDDVYVGRFSECINTCPATTTAPPIGTVKPCGWKPQPLCAPTFEYNGSRYRGCTTANNFGKGWCSHDDVYIGRFSECVSTCGTTTTAFPNSTVRKCGWQPQASCVPSFQYKDTTYIRCATVDHFGQGWCSHDSIYAGNWSECVNTCANESGNTTDELKQASPATEFCGWLAAQGCVPEFSYNNKSYTTCTTAGQGDRGWCSLDASYTGRWKNCTKFCVLGEVPTIAPMTSLTPTPTTSPAPETISSVPPRAESRAVLFLLNARSFGHVIVKVSGSKSEYDSQAFSKRSVVRSITLKPDQTNAHVRFGLTANTSDDANFSNGYFVGLYPNGRLYVPGSDRNDTYLVTDEITLAVESMQMSVYKNDKWIHSWTDTPEQGMYAKIFLRDLASSVEIKRLAIEVSVEQSTEGGGELSDANITYNRSVANDNESSNASNASNASNVSNTSDISGLAPASPIPATSQNLEELARKIDEVNEAIITMEKEKAESDASWSGFIWWWDLLACIAVVALFAAAIFACQRWEGP